MGDTNVLRQKRTVRDVSGGMSSALYQRSGKRSRRMRAKRFFNPSGPSSLRIRKIPEKLGPRSIAGNMRMPVSFGSGAGWNSFGAATRRAAVQEIAKVSRKYADAGCFCVKERFVRDVGSAAMNGE